VYEFGTNVSVGRSSCLINRIMQEVHGHGELPPSLSDGVDDLAMPGDEVSIRGSDEEFETDESTSDESDND
jgi:hypothetical protein